MSGLLGDVLDPLLRDETGVTASASLPQTRASAIESSEVTSIPPRASSAGPQVSSSAETSPLSSSRAPSTTSSPSQVLDASTLARSSQSAVSSISEKESLASLSTPALPSASTSARPSTTTSLASTASSLLMSVTGIVSTMSSPASIGSSSSGVVTMSTPVAVESLEDQGTIFTPSNRMFPLGVVIIVAAGLLVLVTSIVMILRLLRCTEHRRRRRELEADAPDFFDPGTSTADLIHSQTYEKTAPVIPVQTRGGIQPGLGPASSSWAPGAVAPPNPYLMSNAAGQRNMPPRSPESFYAPPLAYPPQDGPYPVHTGATRDLFQASQAYHHSRQGSGDSEKERLRRARPHDFV